ncbi:hypothetical protein AMECASPLE_030508 [Ameca splendens]|uniref:Uncharacterized protein n=1 Tax=Ameca splendens TaxID=208324 RepID=A0ABV1A1H1_9TELE
MRECENLIDSLVYYIQSTVESRKPDDKSTEHCVCILQNLTYEAEFDLTSKTTEHQKESEQDTAPQKTVGCFPHRMSKPTKVITLHSNPLWQYQRFPCSSIFQLEYSLIIY